jgi:hypothetical protein
MRLTNVQAAARCWRDGQKKRCFTYRLLATGTVEEKIFQRQLSKEGLQSVVDDKEQVNALSTKELRNLFKLRTGTPSDTHDKLRCDRCQIIQDGAEMDALKVLPRQLDACRSLLEEMCQLPEAAMFLKTLDPTEHGKTKEEYEKLVKQPMDFQVIRKRLEPCEDPAKSYYKKVSEFAKDVNRIFSNVIKVWEPEQDAIADASRSLQCWWLERWTELVPALLSMKPEDEEKKDKEDEGDALDCCANVHNERGDDYQEQIGMPDEENMRNWSHHHTTGTVDDPIFRAAMRGCDAVSFVFGLEVTWSLIQERQQEEEERQAMEELGAVQELNESDDEDEEDEADDQNENADEDGGEETVPEKRSSEKIAVDSSEDEDSVGATAKKKLHIESKASEVPSTPSSELSQESGPNEWFCLSCALHNKSSRRKCIACGAARPTADQKESENEFQLRKQDDSKRHAFLADSDNEGEDGEEKGNGTLAMDSSDDSVGPIAKKGNKKQLNKENAAPTEAATQSSTEFSQESQPASNEWACLSCTLHNKISRRKCMACGSARPVAGQKRPLQEFVI